MEPLNIDALATIKPKAHVAAPVARRTKSKMTGSKALALAAGMLSAIAPTVANAPTAPGGGTVIAQAQTQAPQGIQASQSQAVAGAQQGMMPVGHGRDFARGYSDWSTFPKWNQRKARRNARHVGSKSVKKRYGR